MLYPFEFRANCENIPFALALLFLVIQLLEGRACQEQAQLERIMAFAFLYGQGHHNQNKA